MRHHEQNLTAQKTFFDKVQKLSSVMREMGNPFQEDSSDLLVLHTKDIANPTTAAIISTHHTRGKAQFKSFMEDLQRQDENTFYQPIKKNHTAFFKPRSLSNSLMEVLSLKNDC